MDNVLMLIRKLQKQYREYNMLAFENNFLKKEKSFNEKERIDKLKETAKALRDECSLDEFDFSTDTNFLRSVKDFCKVR